MRKPRERSSVGSASVTRSSPARPAASATRKKSVRVLRAARRSTSLRATTARCARAASWSGGLVERSSDDAHELVALEPVAEIVVPDTHLEVQMRAAFFESRAADSADHLPARHGLTHAQVRDPGEW